MPKSRQFLCKYIEILSLNKQNQLREQTKGLHGRSMVVIIVNLNPRSNTQSPQLTTAKTEHGDILINKIHKNLVN